MTGDEFGEYSDIRELRDKAIQYYKDNLQGTSVENKTLGDIDIDENGLVEFTTAGRKKIQATSAQEQKLLLVKHLPKLIREATEIKKSEPHKERHKDDIFYDMQTYAKIENNVTPIHITLVKHNTGRIQFYNHFVVKEGNALVNFAEPVSSTEALGLPPVNALSSENIPQSAEEGKTANNSEEKLSEELLKKSKFEGKKYDIGRNPSIIITGNPFGWQKTQHVYIDGVPDENFWTTADKIAKEVKAKISVTG